MGTNSIWRSVTGRLKNVASRSYDQNWKVIGEICRNRYPATSAQHTPIERLFFSFPLVCRGLSPSNLLAAIRADGCVPYVAVEIYVLCSAILLSAILVFARTAAVPNRLLAFAIIIAAWRVVDIVAYQLSIVLVDSQNPTWILKSLHRTFFLSFINLYEMVIAFAIFHLSSGWVVSTLPPFRTLSQWSEALTYSLGYMVTAGGGEFVPGNDRGRLLLVLQMLSQALYVLAILPILIGGLSTKIREQTSRASAGVNPPESPHS